MARGAARVLDEYLVAVAKTGDRKAFAMLAERWHGKLVAHAWRLTGDRDSARDAAQAGWIEIVRGLPRLREERAFAAWAYRIVSRRCAKQVGETVRGRNLREALPEMRARRLIGSGFDRPSPSCRPIKGAPSRSSIWKK